MVIKVISMFSLKCAFRQKKHTNDQIKYYNHRCDYARRVLANCGVISGRGRAAYARVTYYVTREMASYSAHIKPAARDRFSLIIVLAEETTTA